MASNEQRNSSTVDSDSNGEASDNSNFLKRPNRACHGYDKQSVETVCTTKKEPDTFSFLWALRNYSKFVDFDEVKSPIFQTGPKPKHDHSWQLIVCPKKRCEQLEFFSAYLMLTSFGDKDNRPNRKLKARFQITLLDADERPAIQYGSSTMTEREFKKLGMCGYDKLLLSRDVTSPSYRLLKDDCLQIHCRVWIEGQLKHELSAGGAAGTSRSADERAKKCKVELANDFGKLFQSSVLGDID